MEESKVSKWSIASITISIAAVIVLWLAGYGYQWGLWGLGPAFTWMLPGGAVLGLIGAALAVVFLFVQMKDSTRGGGMLAVIGFILGIAAVAFIGYWYLEAQKYPPIHDITTDVENPPQFEAVVPLRADAPNSVEYGGKEVAESQKQFYPDIQPLFLDEPYGKAFDRALQAVHEMPWEEIVAENKENGRIEATDKVAWFGFKDDVVIRVDTADSGSRIDVRSVSRIGRGDLGVNAQRIRDYLEEVREQ